MIDALGDILRPAEDRSIVLAGLAAVVLVTAVLQLVALAIIAAIIASRSLASPAAHRVWLPQANRKGRLLSGPEEFQSVRIDRPARKK
jgi:hypothetical protein